MRKSYIAVMEQGAVAVVTTEGEDDKHCEDLAIEALGDAYEEQVYDICESPVCYHFTGAISLNTRVLSG